MEELKALNANIVISLQLWWHVETIYNDADIGPSPVRYTSQHAL